VRKTRWARMIEEKMEQRRVRRVLSMKGRREVGEK
jgi:hypothetical protein